MENFANASMRDGQPPSLLACWLAGLLEAEGTFLKPAPSSPNLPIVSCRMTDRDVVERVADLFGTSVVAIDKGRYRTEYAAVVKGSRAVALMEDVEPLMGLRRAVAIRAAIDRYRPPARKLSFLKAEEIRRRYASGETAASLSRIFAVTHPTVRAVLSGRIYQELVRYPWRRAAAPPGMRPTLPGVMCRELFWLAGWLEGEGSFLVPPPSSPGLVRVAGQSQDQDVVKEVGRLLGVKPLFVPAPPETPHWSPLWRILRQGKGAEAAMLAIRPLMGKRRSSQLDRALRSVSLLKMETRGFAPLSAAACRSASTGLSGASISPCGSAPAGESARPSPLVSPRSEEANLPGEPVAEAGPPPHGPEVGRLSST